jgi:hypothetical protein
MRKSAVLAGAAALALGGLAHAQDTVFGPGPGGAIPDSPATGVPGIFSSTITVPAGSGSVISVNNVSLNFGTGTGPTGAHTWVGDLVVTLTAPNGTNSQVLVRTGSTTPTGFGSSSDIGGGPFVFVNSGGASFAAAAAANPVPPGTYNRFNNPLVAPNPPTDADDYSVFAGGSADGTWTLRVEDWAGGDTGGLASWTIDITVPEPGSIGVLASCAALPLLRRRRK